MSSRKKINQFAQIVAIKKLQTLEAKTFLVQGQATLAMHQSDEVAARDEIELLLTAWLESVKAANFDFLIAGLVGDHLVQNTKNYKQTQDLVQHSESEVENLSLAYCQRNIELKLSEVRHQKLVTKLLKRESERAMSCIEDRVTFDWGQV